MEVSVMYGQYDSSDGSMDAMGLGVDKKMYKMSGIEPQEETEEERNERMRREYEENKSKKKNIFHRLFQKK